jgi:hypothetical protein
MKGKLSDSLLIPSTNEAQLISAPTCRRGRGRETGNEGIDTD